MYLNNWLREKRSHVLLLISNVNFTNRDRFFHFSKHNNANFSTPMCSQLWIGREIYSPQFSIGSIGFASFIIVTSNCKWTFWRNEMNLLAFFRPFAVFTGSFFFILHEHWKYSAEQSINDVNCMKHFILKLTISHLWHLWIVPIKQPAIILYHFCSSTSFVLIFQHFSRPNNMRKMHKIYDFPRILLFVLSLPLPIFSLTGTNTRHKRSISFKKFNNPKERNVRRQQLATGMK